MRLKTSNSSSSTALVRLRCDGLCSVGSAAVALLLLTTLLSLFRFLVTLRFVDAAAVVGGLLLDCAVCCTVWLLTDDGATVADFFDVYLFFSPRLLGGLTVRVALKADNRLFSLF